MKSNITFFLVITLFVLSACNTSKKSLVIEIKLLKKENNFLIKENNNLNKKLISLEFALEESSNENTPLINTNTLDLEMLSTVSQLSELESYLKSDAVLSSNFRSFKNGGIEKNLNISYSNMQKVITTADGQ